MELVPLLYNVLPYFSLKNLDKKVYLLEVSELLRDHLSQEAFSDHFRHTYAYPILISTPSTYYLFQLLQHLIKCCFPFCSAVYISNLSCIAM